MTNLVVYLVRRVGQFDRLLERIVDFLELGTLAPIVKSSGDVHLVGRLCPTNIPPGRVSQVLLIRALPKNRVWRPLHQSQRLCTPPAHNVYMVVLQAP